MNSLNFSYGEFISLFQRGTKHEKAKTVLLVRQKVTLCIFSVWGSLDYLTTPQLILF